MVKVFSVFIFCLCANVAFAQDSAVDLTFEVDGSKVIARDASQNVVWTNDHPSVRSPDERVAFPISGPVRLDDHLYYSIRADVLTVDAASGVVRRSQTYPGLISELKATKTGLNVVLQTTYGEELAPSFVTVPYRTDAVLGPPMASFLYAFSRALDDAVPGSRLDFLAQDGDKRQAEIERMARDERRDPTNPFLPLLQGILLEKAGHPTQSAVTIDRAMSMDTMWANKLQMGSILAIVGHTKQADVLVREGKALLSKGGAELDELRVLTLVAIADTLLAAIKRAVRADDLAEVDRLANRLREMLPSLEFNGPTWISLSRWFATKGDQQRSKEWAKRGRDAIYDSPYIRINLEADVCLRLAMAMPFVVFFTVLLFVARPRPAKPTGPEIAGAILIVSICLLGLCVGMQRVEVTSLFNEEPSSLAFGERADPAVLTWLQTFTPTPQRDELIEDAQRSQDRLGTNLAPGPLDQKLLSAAREREADSRAWKKVVPSMMDVLMTGGRTSSILLWAALAFGVGTVMRRFSDKTRRAFVMLIPGSHCGPFAPLVQLLFIVGIEFATDGGITDVALSGNFAKHLGIPEATNIANLAAFGVALASAAVIVHVATSVFAWRARKGESLAQAEPAQVR